MTAPARRLENKVALITGAAQGIGRGIAKVFASEGAAVVIADIQSDRGESVAALIREQGGRASFVHADLSQEQDIKAMIEHAVHTFGGLEILINNAVSSRRETRNFEQGIQDWDLSQRVWLKSHAQAAWYSLPHLSGPAGGNIINIASIVAFAVTHEPWTYHVAKAGVVQLTRYLAYEFGPKGVRVNCICPGLVARDKDSHFYIDPVSRAAIKMSVPLRRPGCAEDIARAAVFLCSDDASYITGHSLVVDGGVTLGEQFGVASRTYRQALEDQGKPSSAPS